jgi:hypothetical protein
VRSRVRQGNSLCEQSECRFLILILKTIVQARERRRMDCRASHASGPIWGEGGLAAGLSSALRGQRVGGAASFPMPGTHRWLAGCRSSDCRLGSAAAPMQNSATDWHASHYRTHNRQPPLQHATRNTRRTALALPLPTLPPLASSRLCGPILLGVAAMISAIRHDQMISGAATLYTLAL